MNDRNRSWRMAEPGKSLVVSDLELAAPGQGEARIRIHGCGVCHTDLGFLHGGVRTRQAPPITLGHEIAGTVDQLGPGALLADGTPLHQNQQVVVPAVLPCGDCPMCRAGRENMCLNQKMPGNDIDGGFATHITVPARFLIPVPDLPNDLKLEHLAVVADAVTTPYQALHRANTGPDDHVVITGAGGIGIYGVQIAAALGAQVIAVDVAEPKVRQALQYGARAGVSIQGMDEAQAKDAVKAEAKKLGWPRAGWKVFEMSGHAAAQSLAFSLLNPTGTLAIVGFTRDKVNVRLSNLMAFDADVFGSWGCRPQHYPGALKLIADRKIQVAPFVEFHPLDSINEVLELAHHGKLEKRAVMVP